MFHSVTSGTANSNTSNRAALLALSVLASGALGQAGAQNLDAYRSLKTALNQAVQDRAFSKGRSLSDLQKAQQALDSLQPTIQDKVLSQGLTDALSASRASLARSPAELEAQVTQARGLMRAVLYTQTLTALPTAQQPNQARLLTEEFGLSGAASSQFLTSLASGKTAQAQRLIEQAAARKVQGYLGAVNLTNKTAAYLNLTRAASWFTAVQSAPGAGALQVDQFASALNAVTGGDAAAASTALQTLRSSSASFVQAASGAAPSTAVNTVPTLPKPTPAQAGTPPSAPATTPVTTPAANSRPSSSGSAGGADRIYAALGRALSAASVADQAAARSALEDAQQALNQSPTLGRSASSAALATDLSTLKTRSGLRPSDVQSAIGDLANVEAEVKGQTGSVLNASAASVSRGVGGSIRAALFFVLALVSLYPLYLLNLAFGSRNPYWRSVLGGLVLLLLPLLLEGVFGLLGWLGDLVGFGALRSLTNLTLTQNAWGGPVWALSLVLALTALTYGFRGLCIQFGLLGSAKPMQTETQSSLEWDEEI
ncbi:hypothetical protein EHF33_09575 [Deinococcus psychrotolerans]|uniref:Uncharacterized protein n=1 Tax=Deinococcus psychrotolerans TaxID=2489213 RepID=A0A3G8YN00_9DEIO|nr:hypothetical protein [Deinococcus psychrotolerans]AZI42961.1 hypothetical protein EHF33_09575 [Deinococcus psychrotolerans]